MLMTRWWTQRARTNLAVTVVVSVVVLAGASQATASSFVFRLTLGAGLSSFVSTVELGADKKAQRGGPDTAHTLSVTKAFTIDSGIGAVQVGQQFDSATLQVFDGTGTPLATYRLSSVEVTAVRLSGEAEAATQGMTLSFKALAVSFP
jgi:archaellum biogenesis protein FlaJ (TadC family)